MRVETSATSAADGARRRRASPFVRHYLKRHPSAGRCGRLRSRLSESREVIGVVGDTKYCGDLRERFRCCLRARDAPESVLAQGTHSASGRCRTSSRNCAAGRHRKSRRHYGSPCSGLSLCRAFGSRAADNVARRILQRALRAARLIGLWRHRNLVVSRRTRSASSARASHAESSSRSPRNGAALLLRSASRPALADRDASAATLLFGLSPRRRRLRTRCCSRGHRRARRVHAGKTRRERRSMVALRCE